MKLQFQRPLQGAMLMLASLMVLASSAMAQTPVQLTAADCVAEKDAMRRAGFNSADIERNLKPLGMQNGLDVPLAQDTIVKLKYFQNIAIKGRDYRNLAVYNLALCALNTAMSRNAGSQNAAGGQNATASSANRYATPPAVAQSASPQRTVVRRGNDTSCVSLQGSHLRNGCTFTVDVSFCVTSPQQTKSFFDSSDAFRCPQSGLIFLGAGLTGANVLHGNVHWFACNSKYRGAGGHNDWNAQKEQFEGWCEEIKQ